MSLDRPPSSISNSQNDGGPQIPLSEDTPAAKWNEEEAKHALDELFNATFAYRSSKAFLDLMQFVRRFRFYSPYNAFLIHLQRPGARFVSPPSRWVRDYGRFVKPNANPIVILRPMGPVMFVFDVIDTEEGPHPKPLPPDVENPFKALKGRIGGELQLTIDNAKRDGIRILPKKSGSQAAGSIHFAQAGLQPFLLQIGKDENHNPIYEKVPIRYEMLMNQDHSREDHFSTIAHELGHLYCGHLGTPNKDWWPDRRGLSKEVVEFEAESVAYLVCGRFGITCPSERYLASYVKEKDKVPKVSLECVMKTAGLIENMGQCRLKLRKN